LIQDTIHIAVLGNCTTDYIAKAVGQACAERQLEAAVYNGPYRQYNQEIFDPGSAFYRSDPELTLLCFEGRVLFPEWYEIGTLLEDREKKQAAVESVFQSLTDLAERIHQYSSTKIVLNNFPIPSFSPLGILDHKYYPGLRDLISQLDERLAEWASGQESLYLFDYRAFVSRHGEEPLTDPKMYYSTKAPLSLKATAKLGEEYLRYILPLKYRTKKCLVLDLDNTLWGGVAGEDGLSGIKLDITGTGRSFRDFQKEILTLYDKGVILAIDSKNNPEDVLPILESHPHMVLRREHFSAMRINWQDKVKNLLELSGELNIGTDSMVFIDDSVVERELVRALLPEVTVVDLPEDTSRYPETIRNLVEFERLSLTPEDLSRNAMYAGNAKRAEAQKKFGTVEEYLRSLQTKVVTEPADDFTIPRIAQLTQKTNQFNMTTRRYTQEEIRTLHASSETLVLSCRVTDIYGDNGLTGVCIVRLRGPDAQIDEFLLSCRVLGRNVEYEFLNQVLSLLRESGIESVSASYRATEKSRPNRDFYQKAGFSVVSESKEETVYCKKLPPQP